MKHQMCVRCGKRPAVVFVQKMEGDEVTPEGYCIQCAFLQFLDWLLGLLQSREKRMVIQ